jgi:hypothetical protein
MLDDGTTRVGLWAHRVILSRHKVFAQLIRHCLIHKEASNGKDKDTSDAERKLESKSDLPEYESTCSYPATLPYSPSASTPCVESLVIKDDKCHLATMSSLLDYIYTNEIRLSIDPSRFAISSLSKQTLRHHFSKDHSSIHWPSLGDCSPWTWTVKEVSWHELLDVAKRFGILDLYAFSQYKIIEGIYYRTVVPILFSNSGRDYAVKMAAMEYIHDNLEFMFFEGDPFKDYEEDPACHGILVELTRLCVRKVCTYPVATVSPNRANITWCNLILIMWCCMGLGMTQRFLLKLQQ